MTPTNSRRRVNSPCPYSGRAPLWYRPTFANPAPVRGFEENFRNFTRYTRRRRGYRGPCSDLRKELHGGHRFVLDGSLRFFIGSRLLPSTRQDRLGPRSRGVSDDSRGDLLLNDGSSRPRPLVHYPIRVVVLSP